MAPNGDLYAGGSFTSAGGITVNNIARWNGIVWSSVGASNAININSQVFALAVAPNGNLYVGGDFIQVGSSSANRVAKWDGTTWSALGTGPINGVDGVVSALTVAPNGDLYVGGNFTQAGGVAANNVAKWNGTVWSALGAGTANGLIGGASHYTVFCLAVSTTGDVYAGGVFSQAGGVPAFCVAKWDGTAWSALGTSASDRVNSYVTTLAVAPSGDVYIGGPFSQVGSITVNYVAKWNGTNWSGLGTGLGGPVSNVPYYPYALAIAPNGDVYAGGTFVLAGGVPANYLAKWNGIAWSPLGTGSTNGVNNNGIGGLAVAPNGNLYVSGVFRQAGGIAANNLAKWNGTTWSTLGTGLDGIGDGIAIGPTSKVYVLGGFRATGDDSKVMCNFGIYDPNAALATTASRSTPTALYPNPAHHTAFLRLPADAPRQPLVLLDVQGRAVRHYPAPASPEVTLDVRGLPAGVYVLRGGNISQRLVVE